jgi:polyferredoxin
MDIETQKGSISIAANPGEIEREVSCRVGHSHSSSAAPAPTLRHRLRMVSLSLVHIYIVFHLVSWHVFGVEIWGKTAMMGVPSLVKGNINAAAIMVLLILSSVLLFGRGFCGWVCHMRGAIEFSDWLLRKLKISRYGKLRNKNILLNTRYRWMLRLGALFVLLLPVIVLISQHGYTFSVNPMTPPPLADLPGYKHKLFSENAPFNVDISVTAPDILLALSMALLIMFTMSFLMNLFYGQGAFCRILCPYAPLMTPLMNISGKQQKITRINQCCGCRSCSQACPQGIDVSREIYLNNGKVTNIECIKCYNCIDACDDNVLCDTAGPAVAQQAAIKAYEKRPWQKSGLRKDGNLNASRHLQAIQPLGPTGDFMSIVIALIGGGITSQFGGFWFYPGAILCFITSRMILLYLRKLFFRNRPVTL